MTNTSDSVGGIGEKLAARFLLNKGFSIIKKNFERSWGEIDLIVQDEQKMVFTEVKTVSCRVPEEIPKDGTNMHRPEEKVNKAKRKRLRRIIRTYLADSDKVPQEWRVDLICVYLDQSKERSKIKWVKNIII